MNFAELLMGTYGKLFQSKIHLSKVQVKSIGPLIALLTGKIARKDA